MPFRAPVIVFYLRPFSVLSLSFLHYLYKLLLLDGYSVIRQCVSTFRCCCCFCAGFCFCWYCLSLSVGFVFWLRKLNASRRPDVSNVQWALRHGSGEVGGREERLLRGDRGGAVLVVRTGRQSLDPLVTDWPLAYATEPRIMPEVD